MTTFIDTALATIKGVQDRLLARIGSVEQQQARDIERLEVRVEAVINARAMEQAAHLQQVEALIARVATLEARTPVGGRDGRDGAPGLPGPRGERGEKGLDGRDGALGPRGERGLPGERGERGLTGERGLPGERGEMGPAGPVGLTGERGLPGEVGERGPVGLTGERGLPGERGEMGPPGPPGPAGAPGTPGRDGRDGLPGPQGEKGLDGLHGKDGRDGVDGRDGQDGLGLEELDFGLDLETKSLTMRAARGERVVERTFFVPLVIYRGVWELGREYLAGDQVTWAGSQWTARMTTRDRPGDDSRAWVLSAKRGKDGKPGPQGPKGDA